MQCMVHLAMWLCCSLVGKYAEILFIHVARSGCECINVGMWVYSIKCQIVSELGYGRVKGNAVMVTAVVWLLFCIVIILYKISCTALQAIKAPLTIRSIITKCIIWDLEAVVNDRSFSGTKHCGHERRVQQDIRKPLHQCCLNISIQRLL